MIGIIGMGVVGKAVYEGFKFLGHDVAGFDIKKNYGYLPMSLTMMKKRCEFIFLCLPTPNINGRTDMSAFDEVIRKLNGYSGIVVIKSTVPVGTNMKYTEEYKLNIVSNPEFLNAITAKLDFLKCGRVILGYDFPYDTGNTAERVAGLYEPLDVPIKIVSSMIAEFLKYATNCLYATKVIFAEQMSDICGDLGFGWNEVKDLMYLDSNIGNNHLRVDSERGYGGKCLPKDVESFCSQFRGKTRLLDVVRFINEVLRNEK